MVVSSQHFASQIGVDILKEGGNAVDAAVAVGYAQAVTNPCCGNIGGGGFMTVHPADGRDRFINFRETAPAAASANMYLDAKGNVIPDDSLYGYRAVGVPGTVAGLDLAQRKYGKLTRKQVMAPAIRLARDGFVLTRGDTDILDTTIDRFRKDPDAARIFLRPDGTPLQPGDRLAEGRARSSASRSRPRRVLSRRDPEDRRGRGQEGRRPDHGGRFRVVPCAGHGAADVHVSRLRVRVGPAAGRVA